MKYIGVTKDFSEEEYQQYISNDLKNSAAHKL